ncbi:hypothetical protein FISHEDRAFT_75017 [Fistulina hepatica ATCC 64428]|uniref:Uncharacterized protein n=1 Tax=Fistulina hepatica ATCC 64428 TaxID=1128425 RepID=A0A0D7A9M8_9AGAR|nr:hypothetical protein FISHEDRAFT_75017 [Fistulina hepatica ATCC 64428]
MSIAARQLPRSQVIGPGSYAMADVLTTVVKVDLGYPKLTNTNWPTFKDKLTTWTTEHGLNCILRGQRKCPEEPVENPDGMFYLLSAPKKPLEADAAEKLFDKVDEYDQKEAKIKNVIYKAIDQTTYLQIKDRPTATECMMCKEGDNVVKFITTMHSMCDELLSMGLVIPDTQFNAIVKLAFANMLTWKSFWTAMNIQAKVCSDNKPITSNNLCDMIVAQVKHKAIDKNRLTNVVMTTDGCGGHRNDQRHDRNCIERYHGAGKYPPCKYCSMTNHLEKDCANLGGPREHDPPPNVIAAHKHHEARQKNITNKVKPTAGAGQSNHEKPSQRKHEKQAAMQVATEDSDSDYLDFDDNHVPIHHPYIGLAEKNRLHFSAYDACAPPEVLSADRDPVEHDEIVDTGATSHFTPDRHCLHDFVEMELMSINATSGCPFNATGKGWMMSDLPLNAMTTMPVKL